MLCGFKMGGKNAINLERHPESHHPTGPAKVMYALYVDTGHVRDYHDYFILSDLTEPEVNSKGTTSKISVKYLAKFKFNKWPDGAHLP